MSTDVFVLVQPTVNGPLHVGHLSGPYLAADVAIRAARLRGDAVLALAGVDKHQNYVPARAQELGVGADELAETFRGRILDALESARIAWDAFVDPVRDGELGPAVARLLTDILGSDAVELRPTELHRCADCGCTLHHVTVSGICPCGAAASGGSCEGCGGYTSARTLTAATCTRCGGTPEAFVATVPVLVLERLRDQLVPLWLAADLAPRVRALLRRYLDEGLPEVPLAYPSDWGIEGEGPLAGLRVDVYAELALEYLHGVAAAIAGSPVRGLAEVRAAWDREVGDLWQFHGIDNTFYFAVLTPALFAAAGLSRRPLAGLVVNEFLLLDGLKFSTSRDHAIWVDEFLADLEGTRLERDADLLRLFLCWHRPDRRQTDFSLDAWAAFTAWAGPILRRVESVGVESSRVPDAIDGLPDAGSDLVLPAALVRAELDRAEAALRPAGFDPALAARCVLGALAADPRSVRGRELLAVLIGRPVASIVPAQEPAEVAR